MLPNIDQKWPILEMQNPIADIIKSTHPRKFICLFFIIYLTSLININNVTNIKMFRLLIVLNYDFADSRFLFSAACQSLGKNLETIKKLMADGTNIKKVTVMASLIDSKSL